MVSIKSLNKYVDKEQAVLEVQLEKNGKSELLWFRCGKEWLDNIVTDRIDGIAAMILFKSMLEGDDIESDLPLSEMLYYQFTHSVIPVIADHSHGKYKKISIKCPTTDKKIEGEGCAATGISCGVDSFFSVYEHSQMPCPDKHKVKILTFYNHGSHNGGYKFTDEQMRDVFYQSSLPAQQFAKENGFRFLLVDSNISDYLKTCYAYDHTMRATGITMLFEGLIGIYYFANTYKIDKFSIDTEMDCGIYDIYTFSMLRNENLIIYSQGTPYNRGEKIRYLSEYEPTYKYLHVCVRDEKNDSKCYKCLATIMTLDFLGVMDKYKNVFDYTEYFKQKNRLIAEMLYWKNKGEDEFAPHNYQIMKMNNIKVPFSSKCLHCWFEIFRGFKNLFPLDFKIKVKKLFKK